MGKVHAFSAVIKSAGGGGAFVEVPLDVEKVFGSKRPKIKASIEGEPYRGSLVRMGGPHHMLIILKGIRARIGRDVGDSVRVKLEEDTQPRTVDLPLELEKALRQEKAARAYFESLAFTHRKEYVNYIMEAKRDETRSARISRTITILKQHQTHKRA
jgi:hypothetical protein